ncbi:hypothetical protein CROQUDRAFT_561212 [Cronartium quercuum f. sp. fusiforme G11]|uniref:Uncharacterized protein n=1 Tax=Cronartium quercuum f. sp. fusiforme G11 TaxID=708437 RepID=A0A9P6NGM8_9BASI|nr:hypothetical protein CROQUDRAFT_561212 [Cronartium quercuum f. sp. fusiforme G11]
MSQHIFPLQIQMFQHHIRATLVSSTSASSITPQEALWWTTGQCKRNIGPVRPT